jgi:hypothetical protein
MRRAFFLCIVIIGTSHLDARDLHWRELIVRAELQNDGTLRVAERQVIVFNGDWNGGERTFRVEPYQQLTVHGMTRTDADGTAHPLVDGDVENVDHFQLMGGNVLRWRSRAPGDPAFDHTEIVYTIDYSLEHVLVPSVIPGSQDYELRHDFAFADREGNIADFSLDLALAADWSSPAGRTIHRRAAQLLPGENVVLTVPLKFEGTVAPAAMPYPIKLGKQLKPGVLPLVLMLPLVGFVWREWRSRQSVTIDEGPIDEAWLERNVLWHTPEVAGAFLHGDVGPPEVSALLARMEQEHKIRTEVKSGKHGKPNLHLKLLVPLQELKGAEHQIAQKIFRKTRRPPSGTAS